MNWTQFNTSTPFDCYLAHTSALQIPQPSNEQPAEVCVVDLHQFMPVGGIYHFDALKLPPQAKQVKGWTMVEVIFISYFLFLKQERKLEANVFSFPNVLLPGPDRELALICLFIFGQNWDVAGK